MGGLRFILQVFTCIFLSMDLSHGEDPNPSRQEILKEMIESSVKGDWYPLSNKSLPYEGFKIMKERIYRVGSEEPFTGWYSQFDGAKRPRMLSSFMHGKRQGVFVEWDETGTMRTHGTHFDGQKDGVFSEWSEMGNKLSERTYLIGKLHGRSDFWYENGGKKLESFFEFGLIMEARGWLKDGVPCPYTRVKDGKGVVFNFNKGFLENLLQNNDIPPKSLKEGNSTGTYQFDQLIPLSN